MMKYVGLAVTALAILHVEQIGAVVGAVFGTVFTITRTAIEIAMR